MNWDQNALDAMNKAPALVRGMAKKRVEAQVAALGRDRVTLADVHSARSDHASRVMHHEDEYGGMKPEEIEKLVTETKNEIISDSRFYEVTVCAGASGCPRALYDVAGMGRKIVSRLDESDIPQVVEARAAGRPILRHHKFSAAISGCPNSCSQPQIHDFGLQGRARIAITETLCTECMACVRVCQESAIAVESADVPIDRSCCTDCGDCAGVCPTGTLARDQIGYTAMMGGKLGRHPQLAREILPFADERAALSTLDATIDIFCNKMNEGERLADAVGRLGIAGVPRPD